MTEIIRDLTLVSNEIAIWLKRANDGHYYIERRPKRQGSSAQRFPINEILVEKLQKLSNEDAWIEIEKYLLMR